MGSVARKISSPLPSQTELVYSAASHDEMKAAARVFPSPPFLFQIFVLILSRALHMNHKKIHCECLL